MLPFLKSLFSKNTETVADVNAREQMEKWQKEWQALDGPYGDNYELYRKTSELAAAARFLPPRKFASQFALLIKQTLEDAGRPVPDATILIKMGVAGGEIYQAENLTALPPNPARQDVFGDTAAIGRIRDALIRKQAKLANPDATIDAIAMPLLECCLAIARHVPATACYRGLHDGVPTSTRPLYDMLPDIGTVIEEALDPLVAPNSLCLFEPIQETLRRNAESIARRSRSNHLLRPSEYKAAPSEIVHAYLKNTPLDDLFTAEIPTPPVIISEAARLEHTLIVAGAGWGKTQLLQSIIAKDLQKPDPPCLIVLDSTGAMIDQVHRLSIFASHPNKVLLIDPAYAPSLNMFDFSAARFDSYTPDQREDIETEITGLFNYIFASEEYDLSGQMGTAFAFAVKLIMSRPRSTINDLKVLLEEQPKTWQDSRFVDDIRKLPHGRDFFESQFFQKSLSSTRASIARRIHSLLAVPAFRRMFSLPYNRLDLFTEMNKGTTVLVNTNVNMLKEDAMALFGRYIIASTIAAGFQRATIPLNERKPTYLIVDEAAPYFDDTFEKLLTRLRQFKVATIVAFQHLEQASERLRAAIGSSTRVKYAGGLGYSDRRRLAQDMETTPEFIASMKKDTAVPPQWAEFACYVRPDFRTAQALTVPFYQLENMPKMTESEYHQLLAHNRDRTTFVAPVPPATELPFEEPATTQKTSFPGTARTSDSAVARSDHHPDQGEAGEPSDKWH